MDVDSQKAVADAEAWLEEQGFVIKSHVCPDEHQHYVVTSDGHWVLIALLMATYVKPRTLRKIASRALRLLEETATLVKPFRQSGHLSS